MNADPVRKKPLSAAGGGATGGAESGAEDSDLEFGARLPPHKMLDREDARALVARLRSVSPWVVIGVQAALGVCVALLAGAFTGRVEAAVSALYGAAVVVVPGALIARGMTSPLTSVSPGVSAVSFMLWELVKIGVSVGLLVLAPKLVQPLSWPALLAALVVCIQVYWLALSWRRPSKNSH